MKNPDALSQALISTSFLVIGLGCLIAYLLISQYLSYLRHYHPSSYTRLVFDLQKSINILSILAFLKRIFHYLYKNQYRSEHDMLLSNKSQILKVYLNSFLVLTTLMAFYIMSSLAF